MKKKFHLSLQIRILFLTILSASAVLGISEMISNIRTVQVLENEIGGQVSKATTQVTADLSKYSFSEAKIRFNTLYRNQRKRVPNIIRMDVWVLQKQKLDVLISSAPVVKRQPEDIELASFKQQKASTYMLEDDSGKRRIISVRPFTFADGTKALLSISSSLKPFKLMVSVQSRTRNITLVVTILVMVLVTMVLFQANIYNSMTKLVQVMRDFQKGDLLARVEKRLPGEFGELGQHLNVMLDEVSHLHDDMRGKIIEATDSLEKRNKELSELNITMVETQRKLMQMERLAVVGQMTSTFAHEIGSPLSALSTHLQILNEIEQISPDVSKRLEMANEEVFRLCSIVESLLDRTRRKIDFDQVNVFEVLEKTELLFSATMKSKNIEVIFSRQSEDDFLVCGEYDQLQQVFINVFNNAIDAIGENGKIVIVLDVFTDEHELIEVRVKDTGEGIAKEKIEDIFKPFFTTKEFGKGTGLGLAVCQEIVKRHQGNMFVESEIGKGTAIIIRLPKWNAENGV